ncbi:CBO0543 family protein [Paenibacillus tyrfis]|uniref:CBO0543 family protein n=1 Tax=Paenibacillus tyrfis TaxID=1501230 RepID=UPI0035CD0772
MVFYLIKKDIGTLLTIAPISALIALIINEIGMYRNWWYFAPIHMLSISTIPFDVGLYPISGSYMIHCIKHYRKNAFRMITIFALLLTCLECIFIFFNRVTYGNGWNIGWTFVSYEVSFALVYGYFRILSQINPSAR